MQLMFVAPALPTICSAFGGGAPGGAAAAGRERRASRSGRHRCSCRREGARQPAAAAPRAGAASRRRGARGGGGGPCPCHGGAAEPGQPPSRPGQHPGANEPAAKAGSGAAESPAAEDAPAAHAGWRGAQLGGRIRSGLARAAAAGPPGGAGRAAAAQEPLTVHSDVRLPLHVPPCDATLPLDLTGIVDVKRARGQGAACLYCGNGVGAREGNTLRLGGRQRARGGRGAGEGCGARPGEGPNKSQWARRPPSGIR